MKKIMADARESRLMFLHITCISSSVKLLAGGQSAIWIKSWCMLWGAHLCPQSLKRIVTQTIKRRMYSMLPQMQVRLEVTCMAASALDHQHIQKLCSDKSIFVINLHCMMVGWPEQQLEAWAENTGLIWSSTRQLHLHIKLVVFLNRTLLYIKRTIWKSCSAGSSRQENNLQFAQQ